MITQVTRGSLGLPLAKHSPDPVFLMRTLVCNSAYGRGGIGQHFAHLVEESRDAGELHGYVCPSPKDGDAAGRTVTIPGWEAALLRYSPVRWSPSWTNHLFNDAFDRRMAASLRPGVNTLMGFAGKSLRTFRRARALGATRLELIAPNSHVDNVARLHGRAARDAGFDDTWLNDAQRRKTKAEYALADRIYVHSDYVRDTFLSAGFSEDRLVRTTLHPDPRFQPPAARLDDDVFRLVYVGRLDATKGLPLLLRAFRLLDVDRKELTLVGGWSTRQMKTFLQPYLSDPRIHLAPGDPLPALHTADVFVHPSYEDGFGYAPVEALACGVPVIVTRDTGMKEYVRDGENGYVVPTGDLDALVHRLQRLALSPLATTRSLLALRADATPVPAV